MVQPLMPKATAVWLVESTALTFEQIADFCEMHPLEVQAIADDEVAVGIVGLDPMANGQLTREEIEPDVRLPPACLEPAAVNVAPSQSTFKPDYGARDAAGRRRAIERTSSFNLCRP